MKRKILAITTALIMSIVFVGCSGDKEASKESSLEGIQKIVVASGNSSVPNSFIESGVHKGHEVDIWNEISKRTGIPVEFITGEFNTLFGYLDSEKADTVGNTITINEKRIEKYDFSDPYAYIPEKLVVHSDKLDIKKLKDISGMVCGYSSGSNGGNLFEKIKEQQQIDMDLQVFDSSELLTEAFRQGKVDVIILSGAEAAYKIKENVLDARIVEEDITVGEKAYPFLKDNEHSKEIRELVNKTLKDMKDDGTLSQIYEKWYGQDFSNAPEGYESPWK